MGFANENGEKAGAQIASLGSQHDQHDTIVHEFPTLDCFSKCPCVGLQVFKCRAA